MEGAIFSSSDSESGEYVERKSKLKYMKKLASNLWIGFSFFSVAQREKWFFLYKNTESWKHKTELEHAQTEK